MSSRKSMRAYALMQCDTSLSLGVKQSSPDRLTEGVSISLFNIEAYTNFVPFIR